MTYDEAVAYMGGLLRLGIKLGNERFEALLERLGSPHHRLRVVHIAGTKGKGSTATFASAILKAHGHLVGTYLSPYVYNLRERIQVDGEMISEADFAHIVTGIRPHAEALAEEYGPTTEFEMKTAIGLVYFALRNVDYAVVEVGLGGRLDATNVIPRTLVSVITNIGFDHRELLGDTLALIAGEKAGIIKPHGLCVTGVADGEAFDAISGIAADRRARLLRVVEGKNWRSEDDRTVSITLPHCEGDPDSALSLAHVPLALRGRFQHANAAVAVAALHEAGIPLDPRLVRAGLSAATLPGRFEIVRRASPTIVVDVAHNEIAGEALRTALIEELDADARPVVFVIGVSRTHEPIEILRPLLAGRDGRRINVAKIIATESTFRPRPAADIVDAAAALGHTVDEVVTPVPDAARAALSAAASLDDAIVCVTGSFWTVGELPGAVWREIAHPA